VDRSNIQKITTSNNLRGYKLFTFLATLLITVSLTTSVLGYKIIGVDGHIFSAAALIIPFRYLLGDVIAEIYGLYAAKRIIWYMLISGFIFSIVCVLVIRLPSPSYWTHESAYNFVLGKTLHIAIFATIGVFIGSMLNVFLLSKSKLLLNGKYFWLRSLVSSIIGELTQYVIVLTMMYWSIFSVGKIIEVILFDYSVQVIILFLLTPFTHAFIRKIKKIEDVDIYDSNICFNPFSMSDKKRKA